jgi:hypothetical protein
MDAASHMLSQIFGPSEVTITIGAVEVLVVSYVVLMVIAFILGTEGKVASLAVVGTRPVVLGSHVVCSGSLGGETRLTSVTVVRPLPMIHSIHVLGTSAPSIEAASAGVALKAAHGVLGLEIGDVNVSQFGVSCVTGL